MLEMRNSVTVPVQEHRQIVIDICLCKVIRKFLKIQYGLGYLQTVVVDTAVGILGQTKFSQNSEMRSSNLGIAAIALSKYVLGMVYCGAGE